MLWLIGALVILAAVMLSQDIALLSLLLERELLGLIVESAGLYALYAWRTGVVGATLALLAERAVWITANLHLYIDRIPTTRGRNRAR